MSDPIQQPQPLPNAVIVPAPVQAPTASPTPKVDAFLSYAEQTLAVIGELAPLLNPAVGATIGVVVGVERIIAAAIRAHEQASGQPMDPAKLHRIAMLT